MKELHERIDALLAEKERVVLAIDGPCASGKTTLARKLSEIYRCPVIHMDDFFLRSEQRTKERLDEPGGNLDRERFLEEVVLPLKEGKPFFYRPYDCSRQALGEPVSVSDLRLVIVEGSYAHHPAFSKAWDLRLFLIVSPEEELRRLKIRCPEKLSRFLKEWIPMEQCYFSHFSIREKADMIKTN